MRSLLCLFLFPLLLAAEDAPEPNYVFWAEFVRVIDGNTVAMDIDLGFGVWTHNQSLTLLETGDSTLSEEEKQKSQTRAAKLRELLAESTAISVRTIRDKNAKPPRYLAEIWADGIHLNSEVSNAR